MAEAAHTSPGRRDGRSLLPLLRHPDRKTRRKLYYHYPHYHHGRPTSAIIDGDWELIQNLDDISVELYNIAADIGETAQLQDSEPERVTSMLNMLTKWRSAVHARMPVPNPDYDPLHAAEWWQPNGRTPLNPDDLRKILDPKPFQDE